MGHYKDLISEFKEKGKEDRKTKGTLTAKEQAIFKDLVVEHKKCQMPECKNVTNLTLDHLVPKDILKQFGVDIEREIIEDNYWILCRRCNTFKGNKLYFINPKTKEILQRLLDVN